MRVAPHTSLCHRRNHRLMKIMMIIIVLYLLKERVLLYTGGSIQIGMIMNADVLIFHVHTHTATTVH